MIEDAIRAETHATSGTLTFTALLRNGIKTNYLNLYSYSPGKNQMPQQVTVRSGVSLR